MFQKVKIVAPYLPSSKVADMKAVGTTLKLLLSMKQVTHFLTENEGT